MYALHFPLESESYVWYHCNDRIIRAKLSHMNIIIIQWIRYKRGIEKIRSTCGAERKISTSLYNNHTMKTKRWSAIERSFNDFDVVISIYNWLFWRVLAKLVLHCGWILFSQIDQKTKKYENEIIVAVVPFAPDLCYPRDRFSLPLLTVFAFVTVGEFRWLSLILGERLFKLRLCKPRDLLFVRVRLF